MPPLLLQPLVENAVTHGIAHVLDGGTVRVRASRSAGRLTIVVENPVRSATVRAARGTGVGLANVRARLARARTATRRHASPRSETGRGGWS